MRGRLELQQKMDVESPYYSSVPIENLEDPYEAIGSINTAPFGMPIEGYVNYQFEVSAVGRRKEW